MVGKAKELIVWLLAQSEDKYFEVKEHHTRRTLTQNAYYWQLLSQVADALKMSKTELHNRMIRDFGQRDLFNGSVLITYLPDTPEAEGKALAAETYHVKPTSQVRVDKHGVPRRTYVIMRGSSDYNTKEMSVLVDGLVQEAKNLGIETLTPAELAEIRAYEQAKENRAKARAKRGK